MSLLLLFPSGGAGGYTLTALAGAYTLNGGSAVLTKSGGASAYSLTALAGSYSLNGGSANLTWSGQQAAGYSGEIELRPWYVRRGKKIHVFASGEQADAFLEAEKAAQDAIDKAQATSRQARRRAKKRAYEAVAPQQTVDIDLLGELATRYAMPVDIPQLLVAQEWEQLAQIALLAMQLQDEEEAIELLLLA